MSGCVSGLQFLGQHKWRKLLKCTLCSLQKQEGLKGFKKVQLRNHIEFIERASSVMNI